MALRQSRLIVSVIALAMGAALATDAHALQRVHHRHLAALGDKLAPARVQANRAPQHDEQRAVFLRVPAPETAPALVGPNAAEHGADETEQRGEARHTVGQAGQFTGLLRGKFGGKHPRQNIARAERAGHEHRTIAKCDALDVRP